MEGIDIESEEAPEVLSQVLEVLRQYLSSGEPGIDSLTGSDAPLAKAVCSEILVRVSTAPKAFAALKDASGVMVIAGAEDRALQVCRFFTLFSIFRKQLHLLTCLFGLGHHAIDGAPCAPDSGKSSSCSASLYRHHRGRCWLVILTIT